MRSKCQGYENTHEKNWSGNVNFGGKFVVPESLEALQTVVRHSPPPIRVVGRGHSFSSLVECSGGTLVSLAKLNQIEDFVPPNESKTGSITIGGGTTYTEVAAFLKDRGALRNLPSCAQFTVAGAIGTATHGSGVAIQNLSADVSMIEFVKHDGSTVRYSRAIDEDLLRSIRVHLGCLGVVCRLTLHVVPFYTVDSRRYDNVPLNNMIEQLPELWKGCDSLSVWTAGFGHGHGSGQCWLTFRHFQKHWNESVGVPSHTPPHKQFLGQTGILCDRPITRYCSDASNPTTFNPTAKLPWYDALTLTLHNGKETPMTVTDIQAEFFVPLEKAQEALRTVWDVARHWTFSSPWGYTGSNPEKGLVDAMEFRQIKGGDGGLLSPHAEDSLGIHVSFNGDPSMLPEILEKLPLLEKALQPYKARPHWGKLAPLTITSRRIQELYGFDNVRRFRDICNLHDPSGKFRNDHIHAILFSSDLADGDRGTQSIPHTSLHHSQKQLP